MNQVQKPRIGLALSGGGFRASFFHLGVIRRLEELGLMEDVEVISTVSGGSIIGAYYVCQMEKEQRTSGANLTRLQMCDIIIEKFYLAVLNNLRMKAIVFAPLFHPILFFFKSIIGQSNRSVRMAAQFERNFFSPNLVLENFPATPQLLINTTSNSSGMRKVFYKDEMGSLQSQVSKVDKNKLLLPKVVSASAAVPGIFPPVPIGGDLYSDGGVVDNQGLETLFDFYGMTEVESYNRVEKDLRSSRKPDEPLVIICSDASGAIDAKDTPKKSGIGSAIRSISIMQAGNRNKVLKILMEEKANTENNFEFAFFHPSENLKLWEGQTIQGKSYKENEIKHRLRSEFIAPVSQIRTDLDEFDLIEALSLMYHGYTLVNWKIDLYCPSLDAKTRDFDDWVATRFLTEENLSSKAASLPDGDTSLSGEEKRAFIAGRLDIGKGLIFRNIRKEPSRFLPLLLASFLPLVLAILPPLKYILFYVKEQSFNLGTFLADKIFQSVFKTIPLLGDLFRPGQRYGSFTIFLSDFLVFALVAYLSVFIYWKINRRKVHKLYAEDFKKVSPPDTHVPYLKDSD